MNISVQAEALTLSLTASMGNAKVSTMVKVVIDITPDTICLPLTSFISINGHSISAINPDFSENGEKAMLIAA